jgi:hypothetical protein
VFVSISAFILPFPTPNKVTGANPVGGDDLFWFRAFPAPTGFAQFCVRQLQLCIAYILTDEIEVSATECAEAVAISRHVLAVKQVYRAVQIARDIRRRTIG